MATIKIARIASSNRSVADVRNDDRGRAGSEALDAFATESQRLSRPSGSGPPNRRTTRIVVTLLGVLGLSAAAIVAGAQFYDPAAPVSSGSLTIQTVPPGASVSIAGRPAGVTPLTVSLPAGDHSVQLSGSDGQRRDLVVTLLPGASLVQQVEMPVAPAVAATGVLRVRTEPEGQLVILDGAELGRAPVTVSMLAAGEHAVVVRGEHGTTRRTVSIAPGETVSLVLSGVDLPAVSAGWLTLDAPIALELRENGELIGTTATDRLVMTSGEHQVEMVNEALGFRATRRISVAPGRTVTVKVEMPTGMLHVNALPWADVWVDGERVGQTPIANLARPIGTHQVVLRHPQFGEKRATVTVSLKQTARLGVDMRQP